MRKRLHIATLGLNQNILVEYVITRRGADKVALIYTDDNEEGLAATKQEIEDNLVEVVAKKVSAWDYHGVLSAILEIVSDNEEYEIEYNISCGTPVMTSAAYLAALFTDSSVYFVKSTKKTPVGEIITVQPVSVALLSEPKKTILRKIEEAKGSVESQSKLGTRADLKASSISKHLHALEDAGYIIRTRHGRKTRVEITNLGRIVLNLKAFRKGRIWGSVDSDERD